jgi:hypothetical protein
LFLLLHLAGVEPGVAEVFAELLPRDEQEVLQHGHALELTRDLEGARDLARKNPVGWESINPFSLEPYVPGVGPVDPGNNVKQRGFASAIGPIKPVIVPRRMCSEQRSTAMTPPKRFVTFSTVSSILL